MYRSTDKSREFKRQMLAENGGKLESNRRVGHLGGESQHLLHHSRN